MTPDPSVPSTREPASLPARERILRAAERLFYLNGVRATGIDRIIAEAGVTKVTVYRHFPSKDDLIAVYLDRRHETWIAWFKEALAKARAAQPSAARNAHPFDPLLQAAREWFEQPGFRGCAFANAVAEVGATVPTVAGIAARHKTEVRDAIATLLPADETARDMAWAATLALDGAVANAQSGIGSAEASLKGLRDLLEALALRARARRGGRG
ncbi:MAG: TetR/AcrR family transcriptional regulator [Proteobacteria bacterium]|nr:MAG: TetR/AcrR family transcriptional regulator [Pseudomonadota bacterium]